MPKTKNGLMRESISSMDDLPDMTSSNVEDLKISSAEYVMKCDAGDVPWGAILVMDYLTLTGEQFSEKDKDGIQDNSQTIQERKLSLQPVSEVQNGNNTDDDEEEDSEEV